MRISTSTRQLENQGTSPSFPRSDQILYFTVMRRLSRLHSNHHGMYGALHAPRSTTWCLPVPGKTEVSRRRPRELEPCWSRAHSNNVGVIVHRLDRNNARDHRAHGIPRCSHQRNERFQGARSYLRHHSECGRIFAHITDGEGGAHCAHIKYHDSMKRKKH